jgi:hypothetical protein
LGDVGEGLAPSSTGVQGGMHPTEDDPFFFASTAKLQTRLPAKAAPKALRAALGGPAKAACVTVVPAAKAASVTVVLAAKAAAKAVAVSTFQHPDVTAGIWHGIEIPGYYPGFAAAAIVAARMPHLLGDRMPAIAPYSSAAAAMQAPSAAASSSAAAPTPKALLGPL